MPKRNTILMLCVFSALLTACASGGSSPRPGDSSTSEKNEYGLAKTPYSLYAVYGVMNQKFQVDGLTVVMPQNFRVTEQEAGTEYELPHRGAVATLVQGKGDMFVAVFERNAGESFVASGAEAFTKILVDGMAMDSSEVAKVRTGELGAFPSAAWLVKSSIIDGFPIHLHAMLAPLDAHRQVCVGFSYYVQEGVFIPGMDLLIEYSKLLARANGLSNERFPAAPDMAEASPTNGWVTAEGAGMRFKHPADWPRFYHTGVISLSQSQADASGNQDALVLSSTRVDVLPGGTRASLFEALRDNVTSGAKAVSFTREGEVLRSAPIEIRRYSVELPGRNGATVPCDLYLLVSSANDWAASLLTIGSKEYKAQAYHVALEMKPAKQLRIGDFLLPLPGYPRVTEVEGQLALSPRFDKEREAQPALLPEADLQMACFLDYQKAKNPYEEAIFGIQLEVTTFKDMTPAQRDALMPFGQRVLSAFSETYSLEDSSGITRKAVLKGQADALYMHGISMAMTDFGPVDSPMAALFQVAGPNMLVASWETGDDGKIEDALKILQGLRYLGSDN